MKTVESLEEEKAEAVGSGLAADLSYLEGREPKRALILSVFPGLGQIYNGEIGKGMLFVGVSLANLLLLSLLFFTGSLLNSLINTAACIHIVPKVNVEQVLEIVQTGRSVTLVYLGLILSFVAFAARDAFDRAVEKRRGKILPRFILSMPEATSGSYLFHFSIICSLVLLMVFFLQPPKPQVQTTDIELMREAEPPPPKKAPEPPKPKQETKQEVKKTEAKKPEPPKLTPVAIAVPTDKPVADPVVQSNEPAPEPTPAPQSETGSSSGSPAGTGGQETGGDGDDFDFGSYLAEVQKKIKKNWFPPRGAESLSVVLKFKVLKDGSATSIRLVRSSGQSAADDAAKTAVMNGSPFPALPKSAGDDIDIKFTFDYNVFNGKLPVQ